MDLSAGKALMGEHVALTGMAMFTYHLHSAAERDAFWQIDAVETLFSTWVSFPSEMVNCLCCLRTGLGGELGDLLH